jgi:hypothetical protein
MAGETKQDVLYDFARLLGTPRRRVSKGSTEPKAALLDVVRARALPIDTSISKPELAARIARALGQPWGAECDSRQTKSGGGGTVTLIGLQRIRAGLRAPSRRRSIKWLSPRREATLIRTRLRHLVPGVWKGKKSVKELKRAKSNWRQTEWPGFYFEHKANQLLRPIGGGVGPKYRSIRFDYQRRYVWDFKAHTVESPLRLGSVLTNDKVAIHKCIQLEGGIGFMIACGTATYDASFRRWHQSFSGPISRYRRSRPVSTTPRRRKSQVHMREIRAVFIRNRASLARARREGWLHDFAQGKNSNGKPRPLKYQISLDKVRPWAVV